ncbi:hypothetical protein, partial [Vibrio vulnificus]|uniref:hypothetical protein n=1 Tax=Vibrio vulnificus TaxID=672 RepID=UPI0019D4D3A3
DINIYCLEKVASHQKFLSLKRPSTPNNRHLRITFNYLYSNSHFVVLTGPNSFALIVQRTILSS